MDLGRYGKTYSSQNNNYVKTCTNSLTHFYFLGEHAIDVGKLVVIDFNLRRSPESPKAPRSNGYI
jgi:hypothetical protein